MQLFNTNSATAQCGSRSAAVNPNGRLGAVQVPRMRRVVARAEPFNEGAAQVKRLVQRDRKEFLGNNVDILDQYTTEFGDVGPRKDGQRPDPGSTVIPKQAAASTAAPLSQPSSSAPPQPSTSKPASNPFKSSGDNPFGSSDNPFGSPTTISPFGNSGKTKSRIEPEGLSPEMGPDAITTKETPFDILKDITLTQVVLFFSFTLIIALMLGTFYVVLQTGAIRLNGL